MTMRYRTKGILGLIVASIVLMSAACSAPDTPQTRTTSVATDAGVLVLTFTANHSRLKPDDTVRMQFTVTNTGQQPIVIESADSPVLDIVVTALPVGNTIRQWSAENPDKISHHMEWQSGESRVLEMTWTLGPPDKLGARIALQGVVNSGSRIFGSTAVGLCLEGTCN